MAIAMQNIDANGFFTFGRMKGLDRYGNTPEQKETLILSAMNSYDPSIKGFKDMPFRAQFYGTEALSRINTILNPPAASSLNDVSTITTTTTAASTGGVSFSEEAAGFDPKMLLLIGLGAYILTKKGGFF